MLFILDPIISRLSLEKIKINPPANPSHGTYYSEKDPHNT
jgi:hypothetical protein